MWTHYKTSPTVPWLKKISLPIKKDPAWLHWQLDVITNKQGKHEAYLHEQYQTPPIHRVLCLLCQTQRVLINPTREPRYTGTQVCDHNVVVSCGYVQNVKFSIQDCWSFSSLQTDFQKIKEKKKKVKKRMLSSTTQAQKFPQPFNLLWSTGFTDDWPVPDLTDRFTRLALSLIRNNQQTLSLWCHFLLGWLCCAIINRKSSQHKQGGRLQGDFSNHLPFKSHLLSNQDWILFHFIAPGVNWAAHNQQR